MATPAVGCRVRILKDYATVRYIGPISQQEGTWVGVEWDDPSRGKHDGSTGGVRYFECKSGDNSGSFVRIERVSFGVRVLEALRARYNNETAEHGEDVAADELYVHTWRKRRVQVQLVGEEKIQQRQRQIHALESARLVGLDVSAVGDPSALHSAVPRLTLLDLTHNLVAEWAFVEALAGEALPHLQVLNLSDNKTTFPPYNRQPPGPQLTGLRALVLNDCGLTWVDVLSVAPQLPSLEELHLCGNPIKSLQPPPDMLAPPPPPTHQIAAALRGGGGGGGSGDDSGWEQPAAAAAAAAAQSEAAPAGAGAGADEDVAAEAETGTSPGAGGGCCSGGGGGGGGDEAAAALLASLFPHLQVLTLEEAQLVGWPTLELLRRLPALTRLHLGGNPGITAVRYPGPDTPAHQPPPPSRPQPPAAAVDAAAAAATGTSSPATAEQAAAAPAPASEAAVASTSASTSAPSATSASTSAPSATSASTSAPSATSASTSAPSATSASTSAPSATSASTSAPSAASSALAEAEVAAAAAAAAFPRLTALYLGASGVAEWGSVDQLDRFPALREVRLTGNPVLALSKTGGRFEVIGRVSRLQQLNGAEVRPRERRDSELRYLQHIAAEMEAAGADESRRAAVRSAHPRLRRLMELYGTVLATAARGGAGGGSLASSMVELKLTCVAAAAHAKMGSQVKKLPKSTTVSALRLLCERLFKVKADQMALFLRAPGDPLPEDIGGADLEDRQLGFFGVQDGYEVLVDEADPDELRRQDEDARAAAAAAHEQRLAEQLRAAEKMQAEFARSMGLQQGQQPQQQQQQ